MNSDLWTILFPSSDINILIFMMLVFFLSGIVKGFFGYWSASCRYGVPNIGYTASTCDLFACIVCLPPCRRPDQAVAGVFVLHGAAPP